MSESSKSVTSAIGVLAAALALIGGNAWRDHVSGSRAFTIDNLLASKLKDSDVGEVVFFDDMAKLLKREYVDPITDDNKLAAGAVRGMIGSLGDPKSLYYNKDQFNVFKDSREGKFAGVGAEFTLRIGSPSGPANRAGILPSPDEADSGNSPDRPIRVPRLVVTAVVPGGPAEKAGVKPGDVVSEVDGHWIVDGDDLERYRQAQVKVAKKEMSVKDFAAIHKELRLKYEHSILPLRAQDSLTSGTSGETDVVWKRGDKTFETKLTKRPIELPTFVQEGDTIKRLFFTGDAADNLKKALHGQRMIKIDLRNNVSGDYQVMRKCLAAVAPKGEYGFIATDRSRKPTPLSVSEGNAHPPKIELLVDSSTGGAAEIFAQALKFKGLATLSGGPMSPDNSVFEVYTLPEGSGYTLVTGHYEEKAPPAKQVVSSKAKSLLSELLPVAAQGGIA